MSKQGNRTPLTSRIACAMGRHTLTFFLAPGAGDGILPDVREGCMHCAHTVRTWHARAAHPSL